LKRVLFCAGIVLAAGVPVRSSAFGHGDVRAWDPDGNGVHLQSRTLDVTARFPSGTTRTATFVALYDPASALFWSMYALTSGDEGPAFVSGFHACAATVVFPDKMVNFQADASPMLYIRPSVHHAPSLDEGLNRAVAAYGQDLNLVERAYPQTQAVRIDLSSVFDNDYFQTHGPVHAHDPLLVRQVQVTDEAWHVILSGETGRQGGLTVDSRDFRLTDTEKLSPS
jgi:hypothetical protein